jgi:hypothetical protein
MKKIKQQTAINSNALAFLKLFISPENKIVDLYVIGKWLMAELASGCRFSVKNQTID